MSTETAKLLAEFEALPAPEKRLFASEVFLRLKPWDSGPLDDDVLSGAGDQIAALLDQEENGAQAG